ncbi:MAG: AAA family ATPase [Pedosphaera parvula]|nr:AAA family ATPase [Pedosphaera parvula]
MAKFPFTRSDSGGPSGNGSPEHFAPEPAPAQAASGPGLGLEMIYFTLFRHKWKIIACAVTGFVLAVAFYLVNPPPFASHAKVLIKYVEEKSDTILDDGSRVKSPDMRGETIMKTEVEILTSFDLAKEAARAVGPERILPGIDAENPEFAAAQRIYDGLSVVSARGSSVISLSFVGKEPAMLQPILDQVIETYLKRHAEAHRPRGVRDDALTQETDQLRAKLNETEEELRRVMERAGVISMDEAKRVFGEQTARLQENIMNAEAELAGAKASLSAMTGAPEASEETTSETGGIPAAAPEETVRVYRQVSSQLETLYRREQDYLTQFTPETPMVKGVRAQIEENENIKSRLEREHPGLATQPRLTASPTTPVNPLAYDPVVETARIRSIESRIAVMRTQLAAVRADITKLGGLETAISELQRRRELLSKQYNYFAENLEKKRIDVTLGSVSNISVIQTPSPPRKETGELKKVLAGLCLGGLALGLGLAFAIEMLLDTSVKRPGEIEAGIGLPLMLTIPRMKRAEALNSGSVPLLGTGGRSQESGLRDQSSEANSPASVLGHPSSGSAALTPWSAHHELRTFFDALRNRLIYSFEMRSITRKPKLVAVTSCGGDSGVSTIAAGLAASLSETGDGNVLLVDMNPDRKTPQFFQKGDLKVGLDDVLAQETRDDAMVGENLYMVSQNTAEDRLSWIMPKKFAQLVPKMKASDFDYIIFDMPPVSQISATPQLARFMDQVLMVVESEKTPRDAVKRAGAMLTDAGANVGVVLNKTRSYIPKALGAESLGA